MSSVLTPEFPSADWSQLSHRRAGVIGLIIAEASLLGIFVVAYLFYIGKSLNGPYPKDVLGVPVLNTVCLLASSVTVGLAVRALRQGHRHLVSTWLPVTVALGLAFLAGTAREWYGLIVDHGLTIGTNLFGTTFFVLTGFHGAHVTVGILMLLTLFSMSVIGKLPQEDSLKVEMIGLYWHFVDVVWIVIFTVVYLIPR